MSTCLATALWRLRYQFLPSFLVTDVSTFLVNGYDVLGLLEHAGRILCCKDADGRSVED